MSGRTDIEDAIRMLRAEGYIVAEPSTEAERALCWLQLYGRDEGVMFSPINPDPDTITLDTLAHGLSQENRWSGSTRFFYPVAMHCYRGSFLFDDAEDGIDFMLHDASEGLGLRDMASPLKRLREMAFYRALEHDVMSAVGARFWRRSDFWTRPRIKAADEVMLHHEREQLLAPMPAAHRWGRVPSQDEVARVPALVRTTPEQAKRLWLLRLAHLAAAAGHPLISDEANGIIAADLRAEMEPAP